MMVFRVLLPLVLVTTVESGWSPKSSGYNNYNYDLSGQALTDLYNSPVWEMEVMSRPLGSSGSSGSSGLSLNIPHKGVRVTLGDGSQWLVHKGKDYGLSGGDTVVVKAEHMSDLWKAEKYLYVGGSKTIADLVRAGGPDYRLWGQNCYDAVKAMMRL